LRSNKLWIIGVLALLAFVATGSLTYAAPAGNEYSIYEWWTNVDGINNYWGNYKSTATANDIWNAQLNKELWSWAVDGAGVTPPPSGQAKLHAEFSALSNYNQLWMYEVDGGGNIVSNTKIFDGLDSPVTSWTGAVSLTNSFGFYLTYDDGLGHTGTRYSEAARNLGTAKQVRVFDNLNFTDSVKNPGWILCWEDLYAKRNGTDYATAQTDPNAVTWGGGPEPDYQDMIVSFSLGDEEIPGTPELSTWLLVGLSLAAVPVLRRRRR